MISGGTYTIEVTVSTVESGVTAPFDLDNATQILACLYQNGNIVGKYSLNALTDFDATIEIINANAGILNVYVQSDEAKLLIDGGLCKLETIVYASNTNFTGGEINITTEVSIEKAVKPQLRNYI